VDYSILDDVVIVQPHHEVKHPRVFNIENGKEQKLESVADSFGIFAHIVSETESIETTPKEKLIYAVHSKNFLGLFAVSVPDMEITPIFKTQGATLGSKYHGNLRKVFANEKGFLVQFADLALMHFALPSGAQKWVREESLSQIKQVEVLTSNGLRIESSFEYVKSVKQDIPLASIPSRIANRYKENLNYFVHQV
jgi:hypothetical protein